MALNQFFSSSYILHQIEIKDKAELFLKFAEKVYTTNLIADKTQFYQLLLEKENELSSGLEHGVALPHLRTDLIRKSFMLLATLKTPADFQTYDGTLVNIVVMLCSPSTEEHIYIQLLARISRLLKMPENRKAILETVGPNALYSFFEVSGNWEIVEDKSERFLMSIIIYDDKIIENIIECLIDLGLIHAQILDTIPLKEQIHQKLTLLTRSESAKNKSPRRSKMIICPVSDREIVNKLAVLLKTQGIDLNMPGIGVVTLSKIESMVGGMKESLQF